jgi:hypothetical protein
MVMAAAGVKPGKRPRGTPTLLTPARHALVVDMVRRGNFLRAAAAAAGVAERTVYQWRERGEADHAADVPSVYRAFAEDLAAADAEAEMRLLAMIDGSAVDGDWKAAAWILERRWPDRYSRRSEMGIFGANRGAVQVDMTVAAPNAEETVMRFLAERATALDAAGDQA